MSLSQKARHIKCEGIVSLIKGSWFCANCNSYVDESDVVVGVSVAQQELGEIETQFAEEVMKYKLKEEKEHGKIRFALAQTCTTLNDKIERLERERGELKQKLRQIIEDAKRYSKEAMDFAGYDRISEELEELLK